MSPREKPLSVPDGVGAPAFPPVWLFGEEDGLTVLKASAGLTKLELGALLFAALKGSWSEDFEVCEDDQANASWAAYMAELVLKAAANRQRVAAAADTRAAQPYGDQQSGDQVEAVPIRKLDVRDMRLADVLQFLADTHQLRAFADWSISHQGDDVYDPAVAEAMIAGTFGSDTPKGG